MKIETTDAVEGDKRQHLPFKCTDTCKCGEVCEVDYGDTHYLSYPELSVDRVFSVHFYCGECDTEWSVQVRLRMSMEVV